MKKLSILILIIVAILIFTVFIQQYFTLRKAHSSFENYYAFRGCVKLVKKTDTWGTCKLSSGQTIKIVKFNNKWYLNNDLPICLFNNC